MNSIRCPTTCLSVPTRSVRAPTLLLKHNRGVRLQAKEGCRRTSRCIRLYAAAEGGEEYEQAQAALEAALEDDEEPASLGVEGGVVSEELDQSDEAESEEGGVETAASAGAKEAEKKERFSLNFLWLDRNIGVAVDHWYGEGQKSPLTEYYFWPRTDAWEELKAHLESKSWISERDKVLLLNKTTEVINFWQDEETKRTMNDAKSAFQDCSFEGH